MKAFVEIVALWLLLAALTALTSCNSTSKIFCPVENASPAWCVDNTGTVYGCMVCTRPLISSFAY